MGIVSRTLYPPVQGKEEKAKGGADQEINTERALEGQGYESLKRSQE